MMANFTHRHIISILLFLLAPFVRSEIGNKKYPNYLTGKQDAGQELIHKVTLTQRGYIQFLKYIKDVPTITDFTFCIWLRSNNLTHNHPLFSYSKNENERYIRSWVGNKGREVSMTILENEVFKVPISMRENHWHHICPSWNSKRATWSLHINGKLRESGISPKLKDISIPKGGDVVVGQEYTDFDKGLDDGIEGDVYGFNLVLSPVISTKPQFKQNYNLRRQYYTQTSSPYTQTTSNPFKNYTPTSRNPDVPDVVRYFTSDPVLRESKTISSHDIPEVLSYFKGSSVREGRTFTETGPIVQDKYYSEGPLRDYNNPRHFSVEDFTQFKDGIARKRRDLMEVENHKNINGPTISQFKYLKDSSTVKEPDNFTDSPVLELKGRESRGLMDVGRSMMQNFYNIMEPHHSHYQSPYYIRQQQPLRLPFRTNGASKRIYNKPPVKNDLEFAQPKSLGMKLVELSYANCALGKGSPINDEKVLISWTRTPVRVFGGAILKTIQPFCV